MNGEGRGFNFLASASEFHRVSKEIGQVSEEGVIRGVVE